MANAFTLTADGTSRVLAVFNHAGRAFDSAVLDLCRDDLGQCDFDEVDEADEAIPGTTPTSVTYGFTIPEGKAGGDTVRVRLTDGTLVQFTLPANGSPGMNIQFKVSE